jgi:hypothetical protein
MRDMQGAACVVGQTVQSMSEKFWFSWRSIDLGEHVMAEFIKWTRQRNPFDLIYIQIDVGR